jgi:hypothetical protein
LDANVEKQASNQMCLDEYAENSLDCLEKQTRFVPFE